MEHTCPTRICDVLVIGGGGSGALAAVEAARHKDLKVLLASKGPVGMSGLTPTSNGGTAALGSTEHLFEIMLRAGRFLNDQNVAWSMLAEVGPALERLKELGIAVIPLRGRSVCILAVETLETLRRHLIERPNIELLEDVLVMSLVTVNGAVTGATAVNLRTGEFFSIQAKATVLATGGSMGELYPHSTNNPFGVSTEASASGHAMAFRAGAELIDMEMIQFLPVPADRRCLHLRYFPEFWTGPYLNRLGKVVESDVSRYDGESYSYQLVRMLYREIAGGNGPIYIDKRDSPAIDSKLLIKQWDVRRRLIKNLHIDPRDNKIEITLGSHFGMGGVRVNEKTQTTVPGLFAAGEIMGGVHGALRLPGYSFTQMLVFGLVAGREAAVAAKQRDGVPAPKEQLEEQRELAEACFNPGSDAISTGALKQRLREVMQQCAFVERDAAGLAEGLRQVRAIRAEIPRIAVPRFKTYNLEWARALEFPSIVQAADLVLLGAQARHESRAFHYRTDFPCEDRDGAPQHTILRAGAGGPVVSKVPVAFTRMRPEA